MISSSLDTIARSHVNCICTSFLSRPGRRNHHAADTASLPPLLSGSTKDMGRDRQPTPSPLQISRERGATHSLPHPVSDAQFNPSFPSLFLHKERESEFIQERGGMRSEKGGGGWGSQQRESANNSQSPVPSPSFCSQRISGEKVRKSGKELRRRNFLPSPFSCSK